MNALVVQKEPVLQPKPDLNHAAGRYEAALSAEQEPYALGIIEADERDRQARVQWETCYESDLKPDDATAGACELSVSAGIRGHAASLPIRNAPVWIRNSLQKFRSGEAATTLRLWGRCDLDCLSSWTGSGLALTSGPP